MLPYSIKYSTEIAYSTLEVVNKTCLHYKHIRSEDNKLIDYFYLMKGDEYPYYELPPAPGKSKLGIYLVGALFVIVFGTAAFLIYRKAKTQREKSIGFSNDVSLME